MSENGVSKKEECLKARKSGWAIACRYRDTHIYLLADYHPAAPMRISESAKM